MNKRKGKKFIATQHAFICTWHRGNDRKAGTCEYLLWEDSSYETVIF